VIANQRQTISQYKDNNLKYRYIKVYGQMDEENLYRLERQFKYNDSIRIVRKQVEKYEELLKEQTEKMNRAKRENDKAIQINRKIDSLENNK
jgi:hypothetical protein